MNSQNQNYTVPSSTVSSTAPNTTSQPLTVNQDSVSNNNNNKIVNNNSNNNNHPSPPAIVHHNSGLLQHNRGPILPAKFPGLAKQSNVDEKNKLLQSTADILNNSRSSTGDSPSSANMSSFQRFSASCEDAWDSKIEDKISFENERSPYNHSRQRFGSRYGNIHIIEKANSLEPSNANLPEEARQMRPLANAPQNTATLSPSVSSSTAHSASPTTLSQANNILNNNNLSAPASTHDSSDLRTSKLINLIYNDECCNMNELRKITWVGVPWQHRPAAWKLLIGLAPATKSKRESVLRNREQDYRNLVVQYYHNKADNDDIYRQIHIDIPRMQPLLSLFQQQIVQGIFERILYIWSIRHPASGYVQGMNDLVTPFFVTYLSEYVPGNGFNDVETFQVSSLPQSTLDSIESDSYWSFSKLLDSIQDNYTFAQPGIQRMVRLLEKVVSRIDKKLDDHLKANSVEYLQFAFRWMNNLLIREIPLRCIIRLWDTYLSEGAINTAFVPSPSTSINDSADPLNNTTWSANSGTPFALSFHLFVCTAFLRFWSKSLQSEKDFQGLMLRLQNLPTYLWSEKDVELLLADAYQLKYHFSPNHLKV